MWWLARLACYGAAAFFYVSAAYALWQWSVWGDGWGLNRTCVAVWGTIGTAFVVASRFLPE